MDRREFFRRGISKVAETAVKTVDQKVSSRASRWIRPPFAKAELEFLLSCTRCSACIDACPHDVIFPLSDKISVDVLNTPALDLLNVGCHLCQDYPCVVACEADALFIVKEEIGEQQGATKNQMDQQSNFPRLAKAMVNTETCLPYNGPECGACASSCVVPGALQWQRERPVIDMTICTGCARCREACITTPKAINILSL